MIVKIQQYTIDLDKVVAISDQRLDGSFTIKLMGDDMNIRLDGKTLEQQKRRELYWKELMMLWLNGRQVIEIGVKV